MAKLASFTELQVSGQWSWSWARRDHIHLSKNPCKFIFLFSFVLLCQGTNRSGSILVKFVISFEIAGFKGLCSNRCILWTMQQRPKKPLKSHSQWMNMYRKNMIWLAFQNTWEHPFPGSWGSSPHTDPVSDCTSWILEANLSADVNKVLDGWKARTSSLSISSGKMLDRNLPWEAQLSSAWMPVRIPSVSFNLYWHTFQFFSLWMYQKTYKTTALYCIMPKACMKR